MGGASRPPHQTREKQGVATPCLRAGILEKSEAGPPFGVGQTAGRCIDVISVTYSCASEAQRALPARFCLRRSHFSLCNPNPPSLRGALKRRGNLDCADDYMFSGTEGPPRRDCRVTISGRQSKMGRPQSCRAQRDTVNGPPLSTCSLRSFLAMTGEKDDLPPRLQKPLTAPVAVPAVAGSTARRHFGLFVRPRRSKRCN